MSDQEQANAEPARAAADPGGECETGRHAPVLAEMDALQKSQTSWGNAGILVLGPRNSEEGYPTHVLKGLQKLGCDAGKAIYIAQLREHLGQNILDRLVAIEKGLAVLQKSVNIG